MSKPRVLIPLVVQFSVRYLLRTGFLHEMQEFTTPVVLLRWHDTELLQELESAGAEVHLLPEMQMDKHYTRVKRQLDFLHLQKLKSPSTAIMKRRESQDRTLGWRLYHQLRDTFYRLKLTLPDIERRLLIEEESALWKHTNIRAIEVWFKTLEPDALLSLTPYFRQEQLILRLAKAADLPMMTAILSFDNITTRGWIPVIFDLYLLWNYHNAQQLIRAYPEASRSHVRVVGAPQFDFYWNESYVWSRNEWLQTLGIPGERPIILYAAGHPRFLPHEPQWVQHLDAAISDRRITEKPLILLRRHPNDTIARWEGTLKLSENVIIDEPWPAGKRDIALTNIRRIDIERLSSTLAHSSVHINACSTMTVDGAIFDRPQVGPAYDETPPRKYDQRVKDLYCLEHYLPITNSGGLDIAPDRQSFVRAVNEGLSNPESRSCGRKRIVREICTYDDGRNTTRAVNAVREFLTHQTMLSHESQPTSDAD